MARLIALIAALTLFGAQDASAASIAGPNCVSILSSSKCLAQGIGNVLNYATGILLGIIIVYYFWGIVRRFWEGPDGSQKVYDSMHNQLLWGLFAVFLVLSIWGVLSLLGNLLFGTNNFNAMF